MATQLHTRFSDDEIREIFNKYDQRALDLPSILALLHIKRRRFFKLLVLFRSDRDKFTIHQARKGRKQISKEVEQSIHGELVKEKTLIDNPAITITQYNYSAVRDAVRKDTGHTVSVTTIIARARAQGFFKEKPKKKIHDRLVMTDYPGQLLQHDSSLHLWSPLLDKKWYLITTLDDFSRKLLYAELWERETTWAHICALKSVVLRYGIPLKYYVDNLSVFRYVRERDSIYRKVVLKTDAVDPQWKQVCLELGIEVIYALSPQAKGKIERPYRWLQDRVVRTAAKEGLNTLPAVRQALEHLIDQYNYHWIHSTTKEVPGIRFEQHPQRMFRSFNVPSPFLLEKDIFCLRQKRTVSAYRKISFDGKELMVPGVPPRQEVELRMIPMPLKGIIEVRMWFKGKIVRELTVLAKDFPSVQF